MILRENGSDSRLGLEGPARASFALLLLLMAFLVLDGVAVFGPDSIRDVGPLVAGLGTFWQPVVIAAWLVMGRTRQFVRVSVSFVSLALLIAIKLFATRDRNGFMRFESEVLLMAIVLAQFAIPPLVAFVTRWRRSSRQIPAARLWQFSLKQLLLWTTGISMYVALARALFSLPHQPDNRLTAAELAVSCGIVLGNAMLIAFVAACSQTPQHPPAPSPVVAMRIVVTGIAVLGGTILFASTVPTLFCAGAFCLVLQAVSAFVALSLAQDVGWKLIGD